MRFSIKRDKEKKRMIMDINGFSDIYEIIRHKTKGIYSDHLIQGAITSVLAACKQDQQWGWPQVLARLQNRPVKYRQRPPVTPFNQPLVMRNSSVEDTDENASILRLKTRCEAFINKVDRTTKFNENRYSRQRALQIAFAKRQPLIGLSPPIGRLPEYDWYERE